MATAALNIPVEALPDLEKIAGLDDKLWDAVISAIRELPPTLTQIQFTKSISAKVQFQKKDDLQAILGTAFVLYILKRKAAISAKDLAQSITDSEVVLKAKDFSPVAREKLHNRLAALLDLDKSLGVTSKAVDVMTEHERTFCNARILSDIRPVFAEAPDSASAAVIRTSIRY